MNDCPDCACCRAGTTNLAELDRQAHRRKLDAAYADAQALVDDAEIRAAALAVAAAGGVA